MEPLRDVKSTDKISAAEGQKTPTADSFEQLQSDKTEEEPPSSQEFAPQSDAQVFEGKNSQTELFAIDSQSLAKLSAGSSVLIATLLAIPDAVALIPGATSPLGWLLRLIGVWISAVVLWFVGFLGILHVVRLLVRGISLGPDGIKLWRLAKPIPWEKLDALTVEPQVVFSRLFSMETTAQKLTLYSRFSSDKKLFKNILVPHPVPSFFFKPDVFDQLVRAIVQRKFDLSPASTSAVFLMPQAQAPLRNTFKALRWQQVFVTILIALGLVGLLGRKAAVNYVYNSGNKALAAQNLVEAERLYRLATEIDPLFYAPFNNLANVEFRRGEFADALKNWERALRLKPDFVEPMISISYLHLQKGETAEAKELINSALLLAPLNSHALVNRADYFLRMGNLKSSLSDSSTVLNRDEKDRRPFFTAQCIYAEAIARSGKPKEGLKRLDLMAKNFNAPEFNRTLWLLSRADALLNLADLKAAHSTALEAQRRAGDSRDVLIELSRIAIARENAAELEGYVERLVNQNKDDPWTMLLQANLFFMNGERQKAETLLDRSTQMAHDDAQLYAEAGSLFFRMGNEPRAKMAAQKSLQLEPLTQSALKLLEDIQASKK